jgi:hypothetical protein
MGRPVQMVRQCVRFCVEYQIKYDILMYMNRHSVVSIATGYGLDHRGVGARVPVGSRTLFSQCRPDWLWGTPKLLSNEHQGSVPGGKAAEV